VIKMAQQHTLFFGTGGVPHSTPVSSTIGGIRRIKELGLGCMELEFVHQAKMGEVTAREVAATAGKTGIRLSAHAPYYINLNSKEPEKIVASQSRLLQTARIANSCGARSVVFHAAFYMGLSPEVVYDIVRQKLAEVLAQVRKEGLKVILRPEVMGKGSEFGTVEEVCRLSRELEGVQPAVDVAHWHAREGKFNTYDEFITVFEQISRQLGAAALHDLHIHFSGIHYGAKGELNHLNLEESDFNYRDLLKAFRDAGVGGNVVCESPNLESDALLLQNTYHSFLK
jgi:deoxyribonuclease IV